jgi:hypothetical protein
MNYNELYVFNTAIDGKNMYAVQKFSEKPMIRATVEMIKDILIETGYLADYSTFTDKGVAEVKKIMQFKTAKKYVTILNMVIGYINDKQGILMTLSRNGEYLFSVIDICKSLDTIMKTFPKLLGSERIIQGNSSNSFYVNSRDLMNDYKINARTSFTIKTELSMLSERSTRELFFESEGKKYCYDCNNNMLYEKQSHELIEMLRKRLEVI